ncbi:MAG: hypothetical protein ABIH89_06780, partial [Elusimicrobiota bacterium]
MTNKLRVDLNLTLTDRIEYGMNYNFFIYNGNRDWNLLDFVPDTVSDTVAPADRDLYKFEYENDTLLDNLYMKMSPYYGDITIGKQQISMGTGYAWNPTDVFNTKEVSDPTYEQTGRYAVRLDLPVADRTTAVMIYGSDDDIKNFTSLLKIKSGYSRYDFSLVAVRTEKTKTDYINFASKEHDRILLGGDVVGELFGLGVWCEYAYNFMEDTSDYAETVIGTDYTLTNGVYLMSEYFRNTAAEVNQENYDLNDWLKYMSAERKSISRDQLYMLVTVPA